MELQDWTPSSPPVVEMPAAWLPAPDRVEPAAPLASREESIAEVLRTALAQGRSDEALAGMLRTVMDGASPAVALAGPLMPAAVEPGLPELLVRETSADAPADRVPEPVAAELPEAPLYEAVTAFELPTPERPTAELPTAELPAAELPALAPVEEPVGPAIAWNAAPAPSPTPGAADVGWDEPLSSSLWAETVVPATRPSPVTEELVVEPVAAPVLEPVIEVEALEEVRDVLAEEPVIELVEEPAVEELAVEEPAVEEPAVEEPAVEELAVEEPAETSDPVPTILARTASDPAPLSLDTTSVMPPLSLLPPRPSRPRGGRPPVPPSSNRAPAAAARTATEPPAPPAPPAPHRSESLATVTRLPLAPVAGPAAPAAGAPEPVGAPEPIEAPAPAGQPGVPDTAALPAVAATRELRSRVDRVRPPAPARAAEPARPPVGVPQDGTLDRLVSLGLAEEVLDGAFTADLGARGTYSALTRLLTSRLPEPPEVPAGAGDVLVLVGPGVETLRAARALAASLRLDPDRVLWATRGDLAGLAPVGSRMTTVESAIDRRHETVGSGTLTIVAVDAPLRADAHWTAQMLAIWSPVAVWALVEATRKPEDLRPWLEGLPRTDALVLQDTDLSADPAAVLERVALPLGLPVAVVDGGRATPHRWASLLCERLETPQA